MKHQKKLMAYSVKRVQEGQNMRTLKETSSKTTQYTREQRTSKKNNVRYL